jgi:S-adenosylmethionine/arginine decarboxylase-like enzyme
MSNYWGYHLMLDCDKCNEGIKNKDYLKLFVKELAESIDMIAVGEPWIERTAIDLPDKAGFSLYQLIVTSNISAHFVDESNQMYLDVFSCKEYNQQLVIEKVKEFFSPSNININFILRNAT